MPFDTRADFEAYYNFKAEPWGHPSTRAGVRLHYHRHSVGQYQQNKYAPLLWNLCGMAAGNSVVIGGCGFNWTARGLAAMGADVVGIDTSAYILAEEAGTEEAEIRDALVAVGINPDTDTIPDRGETQQHGVAGMNYLDVYLEGGRAAPARRGFGLILGEDMRNVGSINAIANQLPNVPAFVITEELLNSVTDGVANTTCSRINNFVSRRGNASTQVLHILSPLKPGSTQQASGNWKTYAQWRAFLDTNGFASHGIVPSVSEGAVTAYESIL